MANELIIIVSALIGSVIGSIGSMLISNLLLSRDEKRQSYENLIKIFITDTGFDGIPFV